MARKLRPYRRIAQVTAEYGKSADVMLTELYVFQGLSEAQVADRLSVSQRTVHNWLVRYHIPRRHAYWMADRQRQEVAK